MRNIGNGSKSQGRSENGLRRLVEFGHTGGTPNNIKKHVVLICIDPDVGVVSLYRARSKAPFELGEPVCFSTHLLLDSLDDLLELDAGGGGHILK